MNKVGVHTSVDTAFPNIGAELAYIGSDNAAREAMLASEGVSLTDPNRRWLVKVWEVATVGADQRYVVSAGVGKDPDTASQASSSNGTMGTLHELWLKHPDGSNPTLIRRSTQWASPDTQ